MTECGQEGGNSKGEMNQFVLSIIIFPLILWFVEI